MGLGGISPEEVKDGLLTFLPQENNSVLKKLTGFGRVLALKYKTLVRFLFDVVLSLQSSRKTKKVC